MKQLLTTLVLVVLAAACAAAETHQDKDLKIAIDVPEGFVKASELPKPSKFIGEPSALFNAPDAGENGGMLLVHQMTLPDGVDFDALKNGIADQLGAVFPNGFKVVEKKDEEIGKLSGFSLEFTCPGDGRKPAPNGSVPHHIRWYMFKNGDAKVIGVMYGATDATWKGLEPKYVASFKTLKRTE